MNIRVSLLIVFSMGLGVPWLSAQAADAPPAGPPADASAAQAAAPEKNNAADNPGRSGRSSGRNHEAAGPDKGTGNRGGGPPTGRGRGEGGANSGSNANSNSNSNSNAPDAGRPENPGERGDANPPGRPQFVDELRRIQNERKSLQSRLVEDRAKLIERLKAAGASSAEIEAALDGWREQHFDLFEELRDLQEQVRERAQANRPQRPDRRGPPDHVRERREAFAAVAAEIAAERRALQDELKAAANAEQRREILREFREEQRDRMKEQKELRRAERRGDGESGGDRRPGG